MTYCLRFSAAMVVAVLLVISAASGARAEDSQSASEFVTPHLFPREALSGALAEALGLPADFQSGAYQEDQARRMVFLAARDGSKPPRKVIGTGRGVRAALQDAIEKTGTSLVGLRGQNVLVDLVVNVSPVKIVNGRVIGAVTRGVHGILLDADTDEKQIYFPQELEPAGPIFVRAHSRMPDSTFLYRGHTSFSDGKIVRNLQYGHRVYTALTPEVLLSSAGLAGEYLRRAVREDGSFEYEYFPRTNKTAASYNILRHGGTVFSMLQLFQVTHDQALLDATKRALSYLRKQLQPVPNSPNSELVVVEKGWSKVGGNALALLAFTEYRITTGDTSYDEVLSGLAEGILSRMKANGDFVHKASYPDGKDSGFVSQYYPGEAIFALLRLYSTLPNERWKNAAYKAIRFLIDIRDAGLSERSLTHDHWLLYGLAEYLKIESDQDLLAHAQKIVRAILTRQHKMVKRTDWKGGYYVPPRSTPTATRSEGLCAIYPVFLKEKTDSPSATEVLEALKNGVKFQLQTQLTDAEIFFYPEPERARGGFKEGLVKDAIRIDFVQHNLSSILCLRELLR